MIDITKKYKTRSGREVTQLMKFDDIESDYPIRGVVDGIVCAWTEDGKCCNSLSDHEMNLIEVKEPIEIYLWVSSYMDPLLMNSPYIDDEYYLKYGYELKKFREVI